MKIRSLSYIFAGAIAASTIPLLSAGPAKANLDICNETGTTVQIAYAYPTAGRWWTEGWYDIVPNRCMTAISGSLTNRFYYVHAHATVGDRAWQGPYGFCVTNRSFKLETSTHNCSEGTMKFHQIDVGKSSYFRYRLCPISGCKPLRPSGTYEGDTE